MPFSLIKPRTAAVDAVNKKCSGPMTMRPIKAVITLARSKKTPIVGLVNTHRLKTDVKSLVSEQLAIISFFTKVPPRQYRAY